MPVKKIFLQWANNAFQWSASYVAEERPTVVTNLGFSSYYAPAGVLIEWALWKAPEFFTDNKTDEIEIHLLRPIIIGDNPPNISVSSRKAKMFLLRVHETHKEVIKLN